MWYLNCPICGAYLVPIGNEQKCLHCGYVSRKTEEKKGVSLLSSITYEKNKEVLEICSKNLLKNIDGSFDYCLKRGITPDVINVWELGYVPAGFPYLPCQKEDFSLWWNRILFPIRSNDGKYVIGFGGRTIKSVSKEEGIPKYVNSLSSSLYNKAESMYGYNMLPPGEKAYICEGYIDVLSMFSHGYLYPVASLGTAFTEGQARLLKMKTDRVCICFDSDEPGQKAVTRSLPILKKAGFYPENISVFLIEDAKDVDDVLQRGGTFDEISVCDYLKKTGNYELYLDLLV